jgi:hypothetical protein
MKPTRLNLAALRKNIVPRARRLRHLEEAIAGDGGMHLSRRQMLALTGTTAFTASGALKTIGTTLAGSFEIVGDRRRVAFMLGGKERWVIEARRFAGSPAISIERSKGSIRVELRGALYPGTDLPADLTCEIRPGLVRRSMDLSLALGGFTARMPLEAWLMGIEPARSPVTFAGERCPLDATTHLVLDGRVHAEFSTDWTFSFDGAAAKLAGRGLDLVADAFQLSLPDREAGSILNERSARRALFSLDRGDRRWPIVPPDGEFGSWSFTSQGSAFDRLHLEFSESRTGRRRAGFVAEGSGDGAMMKAAPHAALVGGDGERFGIPLRAPRYAVAFDGSGTHAALLANFGREPAWLHSGGVGVLLGDDEEERPFELGSRDGKLERQECIPALHATFVPLGDGIARPATAPKGSRLAFIDDAKSLISGTREGNYLKLDPRAPDDETPAMVLSSAAAAMVRPEDLLVLIFQFDGMTVKAGPGGKASVERSSPNAHIIVWFQPQNISEQAFFETDPSYPVTKGKPGDPDAGHEGSAVNPTPYAPPVMARMAGLSRLSFKVPPEVSTLDCTLETLLKYCGEFDMNVAPHALPPKAANWALVEFLPSTGLIKYAGNSFRKQIDVTRISEPGAASMAKVASSSSRMTRSQGLIVAARGNVVSKTQKMEVQTSGLKISDASLEAKISASYAVELAAHPPLRAPLPTETSIEAPYRLYISPNRFGAWAHSNSAVRGARTGRTELWHTRLGVRDGTKVDEQEEQYRTIRAIWTPDMKPGDPLNIPDHNTHPFRMTLDSADRINIVNLSSNFNISTPAIGGGKRGSYEPLPIAVNRLMLSSMGAWMDVRGTWPADKLPDALSVEEWRHRGTMGRDHYVRVVYAGFLFPFGHRASLVKVTERKLQPHPANPAVKVAYLRQRMYIVVRETEKAFRASGKVMKDLLSGEPGINVDLQMPFETVRITTLVTPNLDPPEDSDLIDGKGQSAFWPRVATKDFQFHMVMKDVGGNNVELTMPLVFVGKEENDRSPYESSLLPTIGKEYEKAANIDRRRRPLSGQQVAYAESTKPGDTTFESDAVIFGVQVPDKPVFDGISTKQPRFFPVVRRAEIAIPAAKHLIGKNDPTHVEFAPVFLKDGFVGSNKGEVFFQMIAGKELSLDFNRSGDKSGGLVKPNMKISALSRLAGPIAGDNAVQKFGVEGKFNPEDFFKSFGGIQAKLFGVIDLWTIIDEIGLGDLDLVPKFITEALDVVEGFLQDIQKFLGYIDEVKNAGGQIKTLVENLKGDIEAILATSDLTQIPGKIDTFIGHLNSFPGGYISIPKTSAIQDAARREAEKYLNRFRDLANTGAEFVNAVKNFADAIEMAREMKVKFEWRPAIHDWGFPSQPPLFLANNDGKPATFLISVEMRAKTSGSADPSMNIICSLENFTLDMLAPASFIKLYFSKLQFLASPGKKMDVNVELAKIEFVGCLSFVEALRSLIPLDGFSDPPAIDISMEGIKASFSLALPNIAFGVFSLQNLSLGAGFTIPFIGDPLSVSFNFCTRENPFLLTVSMIGGGGYFGLTLDPGGVQLLEAAFEFGASLALDFGVASGEVHIMAGIYFKMEGKDATLSGYLRIGGSVDVLGIITASIELKMELIYEFASGKCTGRATLTIEVEVLFFSASVEISCERKFAGSNGDPSFRQLMEPQGEYKPWDEYCEAFAA